MNSTNSFGIIKRKIEEVLTTLGNSLEELGFRERVHAAQVRLDRERMQLLIVGEFSRGKSTLINALLRQPVLPSKVNPTTAVISVIEGANDRTLEIIYRNGEREELSLPDDKVNKFLAPYLTVSNPRVGMIKQTHLRWPGALQDWGCMIVDTPGVNDLDEAREEVTYRYLQEADACIMILDCQQPLSESERKFLQTKVLGNDIHRILFLISRMDEVEDIPNGATGQRLQNYVKRLLEEYLPMIADPIVLSVSAKEALRARHKRELSQWEHAFVSFEEQLMQFISANASKGRIPEHLERAYGILKDGQLTIAERLELLAVDAQQQERQLLRLEQEEKRWQTELQLLAAVLDRETLQMSRTITDLARRRFTGLRDVLITMCTTCRDDADLRRLKAHLSEGLRDVVQEIQEVITQQKESLYIQFRKNYAEWFADERAVAIWRTGTTAKLSSLDAIEFDSLDTKAAKVGGGFEVLATSMVAGGVLGGIGSALFGPLGVAAAVVGSIFLGEKMNEKSAEQEWERIRERVIATIRQQIDEVLNNAESQALTISEQEMLSLHEQIEDRMKHRLQSMQMNLRFQREQVLPSQQDVATARSRLLEKQQLLALLEEKLNAIRKEVSA